MKRGVPPTARKARTGELTPPGMTRQARSNNSALPTPPATGSVDTSWRTFAFTRRRVLGFGFGQRNTVFAAFFRWRQSPEEAVGNDVAHAGPEAGVQALVEEGQRLADRRLQFAAGGQQRGQGRRERVACG